MRKSWLHAPNCLLMISFLLLLAVLLSSCSSREPKVPLLDPVRDAARTSALAYMARHPEEFSTDPKERERQLEYLIKNNELELHAKQAEATVTRFEETHQPLTVQRPSPDTIRRELRVSQDRAFSTLVAALVNRGIKIMSATKDAGLISAGPIVIPNINRADVGLAFRCGFISGAGDFPLPCLDFLANYQLLLQPSGEDTSTLTIQVSVVGLDNRGIPRGKVIEPEILHLAIQRLDDMIVPELSP